MRGRFAAFLGALLVFAALVFTPAQAQSIRGIGAGGITAAVANGLYCQLIGCTMTGTITFADAVTSDITTAANGDLRLSGAGTGSVVLMSGDSNIDIMDSAGTARGNIVTTSGSNQLYIAAASTGGAFLFNNSSPFSASGRSAAATSTQVAWQAADAMTSSSAGTALFAVYGEGILAPAGGAALVLATPTDTTSTPISASTGCQMSSTGVSAWTPSETGAVNKMFVCCTNTGTNVITMTESAGVYEGPAVASAVGQFDEVCMSYVVDRWVQRSFSDN